MGSIIGWLLGKFFGNTGQPVSNAVVNTVTIITALAPVFIWLMKYDETAAVIFKLPPWFETTFTWGQFTLVFVLFVGVIKLAHWTKSPNQ